MRALIVFFVLLGACSSCEEERPARRDAGPPPRPELAEEPEPALRHERLTVTTADGVVLVGDLAWRSGAPLVVLVHQLGSTRAEWEALRSALGPAFSTFAYDLRGHGESTRRGEGTLDFNTFEVADWAHLPDDLRAVLAALRAREELAPGATALVGSSIGASAAIVAAAEEPAVAAVVVISPGRAYQGIDALTPLGGLGDRPILAVAASEEVAAAQTASDIARIAPRAEHLAARGGAHGVRLFDDDPAALARVVAFLREHVR